jgi:DNA-binding response OmpR family regulator
MFMDVKRILLVEDESKIAQALKKGLSVKGYEVEAVFEGAIAKRLFQQHEYDLLILDVNLPGMYGYELC